MLKEVLEGDYLLQFAFINYANPDTVFSKLQARDKNVKKKKEKMKICLTIIDLL